MAKKAAKKSAKKPAKKARPRPPGRPVKAEPSKITYPEIGTTDTTLSSALAAIQNALQTKASDIFQGDPTVTLVLKKQGG